MSGSGGCRNDSAAIQKNNTSSRCDVGLSRVGVARFNVELLARYLSIGSKESAAAISRQQASI
jgi:hypothetical protein